MANELFDQLMKRVPDPSTYQAPDWLDQPFSEAPGAKVGEVPSLELYKVIKDIPKYVQSVRGLPAALMEMLYKFKPDPADLAKSAAGSRVTSKFNQKPARAVQAPKGFIVPDGTGALPTHPIMREAHKQMRANRARIHQAAPMGKMKALPEPIVGNSNSLSEVAASSFSSPLKRFSAEEIAAMNAEILKNAKPITKPVSKTLINNPELLDAIRNRGAKSINQLSKELKLSQSYVNRIAKQHGLSTPVQKSNKLF